MRSKTILALLLSITPYTIQANELDLSISGEFGELLYSRDAGVFGYEEQDLEIGLLVNEDNNVIGHLSILTDVLPEKTPIDFRVGARIYAAGVVKPDDDVMGLAFGAKGRFRLPFEKFPLLERFPIHLSASIFYSPEITTSGSNVSITDIDFIRGELELTPTMNGFAGIRLVDVDRDSGVNNNDDIVDEFYAGAKFKF